MDTYEYDEPQDKRVGYHFNHTTVDQFSEQLRHEQIITSWILQGHSENPYVENLLHNFNFMREENSTCPLEKVGVN